MRTPTRQVRHRESVAVAAAAQAQLASKMERCRSKMAAAASGGEKLFHDPEFTELYGETGVAKVGGVLALVLEALRAPSGRKLLLFAHHAAVMNLLEEGLDAAGVPLVRIDGGTAHARRDHCIAEFQRDAGLRVALLSIGSCSSGVTLTAADMVRTSGPEPQAQTQT